MNNKKEEYVKNDQRDKEQSNTEAILEYVVILERGETGWGAYVPDLPGCVAAGATAEEVERLIREAIPLHLALMRESGLSIPEPTTQARRVPVAA